MKKFTLLDVAALVIGLLPLGYLWYVYASLPAVVPMHYGADGKPNGYGSKSELVMVELLMMGIALGVYLLLKFLPAIDPKKKVKYGEQTFKKLGFGVLIFITAISIGITYSTIHQTFDGGRFVMPMIGLLFVFLGNMMNSIKPNYFAGVRTPWTLESEDNWRATHRLAAKIWVAGGLIITVTTLFLPPPANLVVFVPCILVMVFVPIIYSYVYFKKHQLK